MKIFTLAPKEDWICDRLASEWKQTFPEFNTENLLDADVLWLLAGWCWNHIPVKVLRDKKVIVTEHHIVPEKFTQEKYNIFKFRDQFVDCYHVPNEKTKSFLKQLTNKRIEVICYWFYPQSWKLFNKKESRKELNIPENKFCITSIQRDTEGSDLKTPKLEKGPDLFCSFIEKNIDKFPNLLVLLGGWRRQYVSKRLESKNIDYMLLEKQSLEVVNKMYCSSDLYVVSSRYEGGPQSVIEAGFLKVPIISNDVGIAKDVLSPNCVFNIDEKFYIPTVSDIEYNHNNVINLSIKSHGLNFISMIKSVKNES